MLGNSIKEQVLRVGILLVVNLLVWCSLEIKVEGVPKEESAGFLDLSVL